MMWPLFLLLALLLLGFALIYIFKPVYNDHKITKGVYNRDICSHQYLFRVEKSLDEIVQLLAKNNAYDTLDYAYDPNTNVITFEKQISYNLRITPQGAHCILTVTQKNIFHSKSNVPFGINTFFIQKLDAVPIPYYDQEADSEDTTKG